MEIQPGDLFFYITDLLININGKILLFANDKLFFPSNSVDSFQKIFLVYGIVAVTMATSYAYSTYTIILCSSKNIEDMDIS